MSAYRQSDRHHDTLSNHQIGNKNTAYIGTVCRKVMVGTTGDQKFASLEKIIVPLESVQRDESKYVLFMI